MELCKEVVCPCCKRSGVPHIHAEPKPTMCFSGKHPYICTIDHVFHASDSSTSIYTGSRPTAGITNPSNIRYSKLCSVLTLTYARDGTKDIPTVGCPSLVVLSVSRSLHPLTNYTTRLVLLSKSPSPRKLFSHPHNSEWRWPPSRYA